MASSQAPLPCPDWIVSNTSNAHAAKDRSWFCNDYEPVESFADCWGNEVRVVGRGTVALPVKTSPRKTGQDSYGVLVLKNVIHCPELLCNIIGSPLFEECDIRTRPIDGTRGIVTVGDRTVAYFKPEGVLLQIQLSDPPVGPVCGPTVLNRDEHYMIHIDWPEDEQARIQEAASPLTGDAPLRSSEKKWLRKHYGGEFKFLRVYGLSIYSEEDREEGRGILRAFRADEWKNNGVMTDESSARAEELPPDEEHAKVTERDRLLETVLMAGVTDSGISIKEGTSAMLQLRKM